MCCGSITLWARTWIETFAGRRFQQQLGNPSESHCPRPLEEPAGMSALALHCRLAGFYRVDLWQRANA